MWSRCGWSTTEPLQPVSDRATAVRPQVSFDVETCVDFGWLGQETGHKRGGRRLGHNSGLQVVLFRFANEGYSTPPFKEERIRAGLQR